MIPRAPLFLGLAALVPFLWGAITVLNADLAIWTARNIGARFVGPYVMLFFGTTVLSFMSGMLWGFAARLDGAQAATGYVLATFPALWAFAMTGGNLESAGIYLMFGFAGLLGLNWLFWQHGAAPDWWMRFCGLPTAFILACLGIGVFL